MRTWSQNASSPASTGDVLVVNCITALRNCNLVSVLPILRLSSVHKAIWGTTTGAAALTTSANEGSCVLVLQLWGRRKAQSTSARREKGTMREKIDIALLHCAAKKSCYSWCAWTSLNFCDQKLSTLRKFLTKFQGIPIGHFWEMIFWNGEVNRNKSCIFHTFLPHFACFCTNYK